MKKQILETALLVAALTASLPVYAVPTIIVTDGVVSSGPITGAGGSVVYVNPTFGDNWSVVITSGETKPIVGSATSPNLDLTIQATSTGPGNSLTIFFSDNGFGPDSGDFAALLDGHGITGLGGSVRLDTYYDAGNAVLALTTSLTPSLSLSSASSLLSQGGSIGASTFSLTEVVTLGAGTGASYSMDASLQSVSLLCAGGSHPCYS